MIKAKKNYWEGRNISSQKIKRYIPLWFYKLNRFRFGDEDFLATRLRYFKKRIKILDVACGGGQDVLPRFGDVYGVDIRGFPREQVMEKGYKNALEYLDQNENKIIPYQNLIFDVVCMLQLNAHIPIKIFIDLLHQTRLLLKEKGLLLIIGEFYSKGLIPKLLERINKKGFENYISGLEHYYLGNKKEFVKNLREQNLKIINHQYIWGNFLPYNHISAWLFHSGYKLLYNLSRRAKIVSFVYDALFGFLEVIISKLISKNANTSVIHGFVIEKKSS